MRRQVTYANVMSTLAVFLVVAGGTALAVSIPPNSVDSSNVENETLKSADLKDGKAVTSADIADGSVKSSDLGQGVGAILLAIGTAQQTVAPGGGTATVSASCPSDTRVISGGARFENASGAPDSAGALAASFMDFSQDPVVWTAVGTNTGTAPLTLRVQAICQALDG
jgi:hypothetical protein